MWSSRFGIETPDDFPIGLLERVHAAISDPDDERRTRPAWSEWVGGMNGALYRHLAAAEHCDRLVGSLTRSVSPEMPDRYEQEKLLYSFFSEGLSSLECLYYGTYFVGALVDAGQIDAECNPQIITPRYVTERFETIFGSEPVAQALREVLDSHEHAVWRNVRNVLTHRAAPGRHHSMGGSDSGTYWLGDLLRPESFTGHRAWLSNALAEILSELDTFTRRHLSS